MPEGPELHLTSIFINRVCKNTIFSGKIARNPVHKCADISWDEPAYTISAESKGKELMLRLQTCDGVDNGKSKIDKPKLQNGGGLWKSTSILFTFGMSGKFEFTPSDQLVKHSHLTFFTKNEPKMALSFVDYRRFGRWTEGASWSADRGPCIIQEKDQFFKHIVDNLENVAFNKPICEVMLNQKFFNGIGNYLRAEILYRLKIPPFERACTVLKFKEKEQESLEGAVIIKKEPDCCIKKEATSITNGTTENSSSLNSELATEAVASTGNVKEEARDFTDLTDQAQQLLNLCHTVPLEVVKLGSTKYTLSDLYADDGDGGQSFDDWLQCYYQPGMKNLADHNNRTMWFQGPAGPLVPKDQKSRGVKSSKSSKKKKQKVQKKDDGPESPEQEQQKSPSPVKPKRLTRKKLKEMSDTKKSSSKGQKKGKETEANESAKPRSRRKVANPNLSEAADLEETIDESTISGNRKRKAESNVKNKSTKTAAGKKATNSNRKFESFASEIEEGRVDGKVEDRSVKPRKRKIVAKSDKEADVIKKQNGPENSGTEGKLQKSNSRMKVTSSDKETEPAPKGRKRKIGNDATVTASKAEAKSSKIDQNHIFSVNGVSPRKRVTRAALNALGKK